MLIAALLELKSRLMLPGEEVEELDELAPGRGRRGAGRADAAVRALPRRGRAPGRAPRRTARPSCCAPRGCRRRCARCRWRSAEAAYDPAVLGAALGALLRVPGADRPHAHGDAARHGRRAPEGPARPAAPRHASRFDEAVKDADRVTVCVTVFALLELYKRGEAAWEQDEPFGPITVTADAPAASRGVSARRAARGAALPRARAGLGRGARRRAADLRGGGRRRRRRSSRPTSRAAASCCAGVAGGLALASHPDAEEAARRLLARPRTPALTPAQAETLAIVAYLQPVSRPEVARIRGVASESATSALADRGLIEEAGRSPVRRRPVPHDAALPQALRPRLAGGAAGRSRSGIRAPEEAADAARAPAARRRGPRRGRSAR